ncbi:MAG: redoxin domain-containing (seleno)protein, partial [Myxococcota bacterium]
MATHFTLVDGSDPVVLSARVSEGRVYLDPDGLRDTLGWRLRDEGLCRGETCVPVRDREALVGSGGIGLGAFAAALGRPLAV